MLFNVFQRLRYLSGSPSLYTIKKFPNKGILACFSTSFDFSFKYPNVRMGGCVSKFKTDDDCSNHRAKFSGGSVHMITTKESWDEKLAEAEREDKVVIANFSATWCGPCKMLAPFYVELSTKHPSFMFLLIDVDELIDFSSSMDVNATPTLIFLKNGQPIGKLIGENRVELQKKILSIADSMPTTAK